ncbi:MAG: BlaI/MecI/CopY family transcriptional regulator [Planctomycetota bacterium]
MARKRAGLSKGEMVVASALWRLGNATLGELYKEVEQTDSMEYATVQSYIRRLEAKGYVKSKKEGRNKCYRAAVKPEKVIGQNIDELLDQLVSGQSLPVFRHLIEQRRVSQDELQELRRMIDDAERDEQQKDRKDDDE